MSPTPAWQTDGWTLPEGFAKIDQQWDVVRELLAEQDLYDLRQETISGWSCGEHAGHVTLVAHWIATGIQENLADRERNTEGQWTDRAGPILEAGGFPRGVAEAPERVSPANRSREDFLTVIPAAVSAWEGIRARSAALPYCPARFPHFALGYLTSSEWVRFCALHTAHHLAIVRDIRKGAGNA